MWAFLVVATVNFCAVVESGYSDIRSLVKGPDAAWSACDDASEFIAVGDVDSSTSTGLARMTVWMTIDFIDFFYVDVVTVVETESRCIRAEDG